MENTITATLVSVIFIIIILEILRYFRKSKKLMIEFEDLERRVKFLENKINEDWKVTMAIISNFIYD